MVVWFVVLGFLSAFSLRSQRVLYSDFTISLDVSLLVWDMWWRSEIDIVYCEG